MPSSQVSGGVGAGAAGIAARQHDRQGTDRAHSSTSIEGALKPRVLHYDGKSWTIVKGPANFVSFGGLVVRSKSDIWLAGAQPTFQNIYLPGVMHFNGKKWSFVPVATTALAVRSVADDGQGGLWALTTSSPSELWHDVKGHWSKVTSCITKPELSQLFHIPGSSATLGIGTDSTGPAVFATGDF